MYSAWTCLPCVLSELLSFRWGQGRCLDLCPIPAYIDRIHPDYIPILQIDQVFELRPGPDHAEKLARHKHITSPPQFISVDNFTAATTTGNIVVDEPASTIFAAADPADASVTGTIIISDHVSYEETKNTFLPAVFLLHLQNIYLDILEVWDSREFWSEAFGILFENCGSWLFLLAVICALPFCALLIAALLFFFEAEGEGLKSIASLLSPHLAHDDEDAADERPLSQILIPWATDKNTLNALQEELKHKKEENVQLTEQKQSLHEELNNEKAKNSRLLSQKDVTDIENQKILAAIQARIVELEAEVHSQAKKAATQKASLKLCQYRMIRQKKSFSKKNIGYLKRMKDASDNYDAVLQDQGADLQEASADLRATSKERMEFKNELASKKVKLNELKNDYDELLSDYHELNDDYHELQGDKDKLKDDYDELLHDHDKLQDRYDELEDNYNGSQNDLKECDTYLQVSKAEVKAVTADRDELQVKLWHAGNDIRESNEKFAEANKRAADFQSKYNEEVREKTQLASENADLREELDGEKWDIAEEHQKELDHEKEIAKRLREDIAALKEELRRAPNDDADITAPGAQSSSLYDDVSLAEPLEVTREVANVEEAAEAVDDSADFAPGKAFQVSSDHSLQASDDDSSLFGERQFYDAATGSKSPEGMTESANDDPADTIDHAAEFTQQRPVEDLPEITLDYQYDDINELFSPPGSFPEDTNVQVAEATDQHLNDEPAENIDQWTEAAPEEASEETINDASDYDSDDTLLSLSSQQELTHEATAAKEEDSQVDQNNDEEDKDVAPLVVRSRPFAYPTITLPIFSLLCDYQNQSILNHSDTEVLSQASIAAMAENQEGKKHITGISGTVWIHYDERRRDISRPTVVGKARSSRFSSYFNQMRRGACKTMGLIEYRLKFEYERTLEELAQLPISLFASNATNDYSYTKDPAFPESRRRRHSITFGDLDEPTFKRIGCVIPRRTPANGTETRPVYKGVLNNGTMLTMDRKPGTIFDLLLDQRHRISQRVPAVEQRSLTEQFFKVKGSNSSNLIIADSNASITDILGIDNLRQHQVDAGHGEAVFDIINGNVMDITRSTWSKTTATNNNEICEVRTLNHLHDPWASPEKKTNVSSSPTKSTTSTSTEASSALDPAAKPFKPKPKTPTLAERGLPENTPTGPSPQVPRWARGNNNNNNNSSTHNAMQGGFRFGVGGDQAPRFTLNMTSQQDSGLSQQPQQPVAFNPPAGPRSSDNMGGVRRGYTGPAPRGPGQWGHRRY